MPINFQRLKAGQPWKVTEPTGRAIIEVAEDWAKHARDVDPAAPPVYEFAGDILEVRNDTGAALPRFSVAGLDGGALILPGSNLIEFQNYPRFSLSTPALPADSGKFCITVEPLPLGAIGLALFSGVVPCQVMLTEGAAPPIFGDATAGQTYLTPATAGAQILWYDSTVASGLAWAYVRIPHNGGLESADFSVLGTATAGGGGYEISTPATTLKFVLSAAPAAQPTTSISLSANNTLGNTIQISRPGRYAVDWTVSIFTTAGPSGCQYPWLTPFVANLLLTRSGGSPGVAAVNHGTYGLGPAGNVCGSSSPGDALQGAACVVTEIQLAAGDVPATIGCQVISTGTSGKSGQPASAPQLNDSEIRLLRIGD